MSNKTLQGEYRCNNAVEAWHNAFEGGAKKKKTLITLVEKIRVEQESTEVHIAQLEGGTSYERSKAMIAKDKALGKAIEKFDRDSIYDFLDKITMILKKKLI